MLLPHCTVQREILLSLFFGVVMIQVISFGYKSILKKYWLQGKMQSVKKGLYGDVLTQSNCSLEHLTPHCQKGATNLSNLALASKAKNNARGCQPLKNFLTQPMADEYLSQFKGIKLEGFDGDKYAKILGEKIKRMLK